MTIKFRDDPDDTKRLISLLESNNLLLAGLLRVALHDSLKMSNVKKNLLLDLINEQLPREE